MSTPSSKAPNREWIKRLLLAGLAIMVIATVAKCSGGSTSGFGGYSKTIHVEIATLEETRLCGVQSGERKFTAPKKIPVIIGGNRHDLEEWILINGTVAKERFAVASDGCVTITFALVNSDKKKPISPQIIPIKFE